MDSFFVGKYSFSPYQACAHAGLATLVPHWIYRTRLPLYDEVDVLMQHMASLYRGRDRPVDRQRRAHERFARWLDAEKKRFDRRRSLRGSDLEANLREMARGEALEELLGNARLASFLGQVILNRRTFDYASLAWSADPG